MAFRSDEVERRQRRRALRPQVRRLSNNSPLSVFRLLPPSLPRLCVSALRLPSRLCSLRTLSSYIALPGPSTSPLRPTPRYTHRHTLPGCSLRPRVLGLPFAPVFPDELTQAMLFLLFPSLLLRYAHFQRNRGR